MNVLFEILDVIILSTFCNLKSRTFEKVERLKRNLSL